MQGPHRDDMPDELLEEMEKQFPGMKICFVGDLPEGHEYEEQARAVERQLKEEMYSGRCHDCQCEQPEFHDWLHHEENKEEEPPPAVKSGGWAHMPLSGYDDPPIILWLCPTCQEKDDEEC